MRYGYGRQVRKRDGRLVMFERSKIADAIFRAAQAVGGEDRFLAEQLAGIVANRVMAIASRDGSPRVPTIEDVQDAVEKVLIEAGHAQTAKSFILYRDRRSQARATRGLMSRGLVGREGGNGTRLLVGGGGYRHQLQRADSPNPSSLRPFSKAAIASELMLADGADRNLAQEVARAVEERVLRSSFERMNESMLTSLVQAEMFERGKCTRFGEGDLAREIRRAATWALHASEPTDDDAHSNHADFDPAEFGPNALPPANERGPGAGREQPFGVASRMDPLRLARANPGARLEWLGEQVLATHILAGELSPSAVEAHRLGDLHFYDLGSPFRLAALSLDAVAVGSPLLAGDSFSRGMASLRAFHVIESMLLTYQSLASRVLCIEHVNVFLAPFVDQLDDAALGEALRAFFLCPALTAPGLGASAGRTAQATVEFTLSSDVPDWHRFVPTPSPAAPGRTFGDFDDVVRRVGVAMVTELSALRREGRWPACRLNLIVPRVQSRSTKKASTKNTCTRITNSQNTATTQKTTTLKLTTTKTHEAGEGKHRAANRMHDESPGVSLCAAGLREASRGGDPVFLFDDRAMPRRGPSWFRVAEHEFDDPFRFPRGDVNIASLAAINMVALVRRVGQAGVDDVLREARRLIRVALEGAEFRRRIQRAMSAAPGGALYGLSRSRAPGDRTHDTHQDDVKRIPPRRSESHPGPSSRVSSDGPEDALRVALSKAYHVVEVVGLTECALHLGRMERNNSRTLTEADQAQLVELIRSNLAACLEYEAAPLGIRASLVEAPREEAKSRFAELNLVRFATSSPTRFSSLRMSSHRASLNPMHQSGNVHSAPDDSESSDVSGESGKHARQLRGDHSSPAEPRTEAGNDVPSGASASASGALPPDSLSPDSLSSGSLPPQLGPADTGREALASFPEAGWRKPPGIQTPSAITPAAFGLSSKVARLDTQMPAGRIVRYDLRVRGDAPPGMKELQAHFAVAVEDPSAHALHVTPWPRRVIRRAHPGAGDQ